MKIDRLDGMHDGRFAVTISLRLQLRFLLGVMLLAFGLTAGWPRAGIADARPGALVLVGDVLRFNHPLIWNRIYKLSERDLSDLAIIAAANKRPKLYGGFAKRALERHGALAEIVPVAMSPDEFGVPYQRAVNDPALVKRLQDANGVFFVGGAPERLARVLYNPDGSPTPMGDAIARVYHAGGVIVGGISGPAGVRTGIDAMAALDRGRFPERDMYRGLGLIAHEWYVDQHIFTAGRFAETLVAMRQLGLPYGIGVGIDTAAVVEANRVEVVGDQGVVIIDLSRATSSTKANGGFSLKGARLSYLDHGDVLDMSTKVATPHPEKLEEFEIRPNDALAPRSARHGEVVEDMFAKGRLAHLLREALDGESNEATGLAFRKGAGDHDGGYRFRFYTGSDSVGWLSVRSGTERITILNIHLDIEPLTKKQSRVFH